MGTCKRKKLEDMTLEELWELFPIILKPYNPLYPAIYRQMKRRLMRRLKTHPGVARITHIGSTSVPGLLAKPTIDILLETELPDGLIIYRLKAAGWRLIEQSDNPFWHLDFNYGYTRRGFARHVYHLHIRRPGDWDELYFASYLRHHADTATAYASLKKDLAIRYEHNRDEYTRAKGDFIGTIVKAARKEMPNKYLPK